MSELTAIYDLVGRATPTRRLDFSTDTTDPAAGALLARVEERSTALATLPLLFFELDRRRFPTRAPTTARLRGARLLRPHLRTARRYRPHLLSQPRR